MDYFNYMITGCWKEFMAVTAVAAAVVPLPGQVLNECSNREF